MAKATQRFKVECMLAGLGIAPFSSESVKRYKSTMAERANSRPSFVLPFVLGFASFMVNVKGTVLFFSSLLAISVDATLALFALMGFSSVIMGIRWWFAWEENPSSSGVFRWKAHQIRGYNRPIPEFALDTALKVARNIPNGELLIDELEEHKRVDPFLVLAVDGEWFYLEVWDEPRFDGTRE